MIFILFTILLPLLVALGILISPLWPMKKVVNRKKFGILIGSSVIISSIVCGGLYFGAHRKLYFKEVWNYKRVSIKHEEKWTTHETRQERYQSGTDSKGNPTYSYRTVHYTEYHGPYWTVYNEYETGHNFFSGTRISQSEYNKWAKIFGTEKKTGIHKGSSYMAKAITGGIYEAHWPGTFDTIYPHSEIKEYVNKARVSKNTITKLSKPTEAQKKKYPRPVNSGNTNPIISYGPSFSKKDMLLIRRCNAFLGRKHEIHAMIVAFNSKDGRGQIREVLTAWEGTNKNELIMFVGLGQDRKVEWCEVHNWLSLGDSTVNNMWRDHVMGKKFDISHVAKGLLEFVPKHWSRPQAVTIDYLKIDIHWGWGLAAFLSVMLITTASFFVVEYKIFENVDEFGEYKYSKWGW